MSDRLTSLMTIGLANYFRLSFSVQDSRIPTSINHASSWPLKGIIRPHHNAYREVKTDSLVARYVRVSANARNVIYLPVLDPFFQDADVFSVLYLRGEDRRRQNI